MPISDGRADGLDFRPATDARTIFSRNSLSGKGTAPSNPCLGMPYSAHSHYCFQASDEDEPATRAQRLPERSSERTDNRGDGLPKRKSQKRHTTRNVMKKLIVLILCLTACRTADAQSVRFFATADDYLNGRFDTLPRSSLKIRQLFVSINKTGLSDNELRDKLKTNELHLLVFEDSLYANLSTTSIGKPSNRFRRVERFGDRIFFWTWPANHMLYVGIEGGIGGGFFEVFSPV